MKRLTALLLSLLLLASFELTAYADASSVEYTDKETEAVFIVPSGWKEVRSEKIEYNSDYCFELEEPDEEEDEKVTYMTYSSAAFKSEDRNDIAQYLNIPEDLLKDAEYNRVHYYRFATRAKHFTKYFGKKQKCVGYVTVREGYIYQLMFFDAVRSPVYDDFKSLMGSLEIKGTVPEKPKAEKVLTPSKVISLGVMLAFIAAFITVLIKTKKK